jgi:hypothetical protein
MITVDDVVRFPLSAAHFAQCVANAQTVAAHLVDRPDLHARDDLERFIHLLMGEVAERMVLEWLRAQGKAVRSTVDKAAQRPDGGHDLVLRATDGRELFCSVKSSLSYKLTLEQILATCKLATKASELRDVNIQVYFWLTLNPDAAASRVTVPALRQSALLGWFAKGDLRDFAPYRHEKRQAPAPTLRTARPMQSLLAYLV